MDYKWSERFLKTRAEAQTAITGSSLNYPGFTIISDAVGSKVLRVENSSANSISPIAINLTDGTIGLYDITADTFSIMDLNHILGNKHSNYTPVFTPQNNVLNTCDVVADSLVIEVDTDSVTFFVTVHVTLDVADIQESFIFNLVPPPSAPFGSKFDLRGLVGRADATITSDFYGILQAVSGDVTGKLFINSGTPGVDGNFVLSGRYHK